MQILVVFLPSTSADTPMFLLIWKHLPNSAWRRVDIVGAFILLAASVLVVFVLEEEGIRYAWNSAAIIAGLTLGCLCWVSFCYENTTAPEQSPNRNPFSLCAYSKIAWSQA
jgi:xanthine/uracil permease